MGSEVVVAEVVPEVVVAATSDVGQRPTGLFLDLRRTVWWWFVVVGAGGLIGGLVGGIGGRLVMFVLRLTSPENLRGIETDDGAIIGDFTFDGTLFLAMFVAALGGLYGGLYGLLRSFITPSWRIALSAVLVGLVGGALLIHDDGIDFSLLRPRAFAVVSFIAIPALMGAGTAWLVERWSYRTPLTRTRKGALALGFVPTVLFLPLAAIGLVASVAVAVLAQFGPLRAVRRLPGPRTFSCNGEQWLLHSSPLSCWRDDEREIFS